MRITSEICPRWGRWTVGKKVMTSPELLHVKARGCVGVSVVSCCWNFLLSFLLLFILSSWLLVRDYFKISSASPRGSKTTKADTVRWRNFFELAVDYVRPLTDRFAVWLLLFFCIDWWWWSDPEGTSCLGFTFNPMITVQHIIRLLWRTHSTLFVNSLLKPV